jgi:putative Holliday junction resolvase
MGRILAIDYGERRIGLAISDETRTIAQGLRTIDAGPRTANPGPRVALEQIAEIVRQNDVELIILGYPTSMNGKPSTRGNEVEGFQALLEKAVKVPIELVDERFTTALANRYLGEGHKKVRPDKQPVDIVAATILLEDYLEGVGPAVGSRRTRTDELEPAIEDLEPGIDDPLPEIEVQPPTEEDAS